MKGKSLSAGLGRRIRSTSIAASVTMAIQSKTAFQLQQMIAEMAGFHPDNIDVMKLDSDGAFRAVLIGTVAAVSKSKAQSDIENACRQLRLKYRLQV